MRWRRLNSRYLDSGAGPLQISKALHDGNVVRFNSLTGCTVTLPAATGSGARYRFVITVVPTSNSLIIKVNNTTDIFNGIVFQLADDAAALAGFAANGTTDDTITLNRTTTGATAKGEFIEVEDIAPGVYHVSGSTKPTGAEATPFSATV